MTVSATMREAVRQRADQRCEYCLKPEGETKYPHHVDHIIPRKHQGSDELDNLAWACFQCNTTRGSDVAIYDLETGVLTPLFNPRTQGWHEHFEKNGPLIVARTAIGRVTILALAINHPAQIDTRRYMIERGVW